MVSVAGREPYFALFLTNEHKLHRLPNRYEKRDYKGKIGEQLWLHTITSPAKSAGLGGEFSANSLGGGETLT